MGPSLDLSLRRHLPPDPVLLKHSLRRPKLKKTEVEKGLGRKRKNVEVDEMGDLRGRVHVGKQDLGRLQTRKMKGLKSGGGVDVDVDVDMEEGGDDEDGQSRSKRRKEE
jgi:ribosome production factor 2